PDRNVADILLDHDVTRDRFDDIRDAFVRFVVGVEDSGRVGMNGQSNEEVGEVAVVDARPVVATVSNHAYQSVFRVLYEIADDSPRPAIDDAGPHDCGANPAIARQAAHECFVLGTPRGQWRRLEWGVFRRRT